jgi:hypothetical protein
VAVSATGAHRQRAQVRPIPTGPTETVHQSDADMARRSDTDIDLERLSKDQIAEWIIPKFKGHDMARLVAAVLKAPRRARCATGAGA